MKFELKPGKYNLANGDLAGAEVFAERDGYFYGRAGNLPVAWHRSGKLALASKPLIDGCKYDILPPVPVKKWRWVMRHAVGYLTETVSHHDCAADAEVATYMATGCTWKAIARIEGSEVEE